MGETMKQSCAESPETQSSYGELADFRTNSAEKFEESIKAVAAYPVSIDPEIHSPFHAEVKLARLPRLGIFKIWTSAMRACVPESNGQLTLIIPLVQQFTIAERGKREAFEPGTAHLTNFGLPLDLCVPDGGQRLIVNFNESLVNSNWDKLSGGKASGALAVRSRFSIMTPQGASFWRFLSFVWSEICRGSTALRSPLVAREIEDALLAILLYALNSGTPDGRQPRVVDVSSLHVRRAEEYMLAHLCEPTSMGDIAEAVGANARTLARAFKRHHGVGPIAFLKQRRLENAQRILLGADPRSSSVTEVAIQLGFCHLGQFSKDYKQAFQEGPSETLRR